MKAKRDLLNAICFEDPEHIPRKDVTVCFQFEGNFKMEDWIDKMQRRQVNRWEKTRK